MHPSGLKELFLTAASRDRTQAPQERGEGIPAEARHRARGAEAEQTHAQHTPSAPVPPLPFLPAASRPQPPCLFLT